MHVRKWWLFGEIDLVEVEIVEVNYLIYLFALCEDSLPLFSSISSIFILFFFFFFMIMQTPSIGRRVH